MTNKLAGRLRHKEASPAASPKAIADTARPAAPPDVRKVIVQVDVQPHIYGALARPLFGREKRTWADAIKDHMVATSAAASLQRATVAALLATPAATGAKAITIRWITDGQLRYALAAAQDDPQLGEAGRYVRKFTDALRGRPVLAAVTEKHNVRTSAGVEREGRPGRKPGK